MRKLLPFTILPKGEIDPSVIYREQVLQLGHFLLSLLRRLWCLISAVHLCFFCSWFDLMGGMFWIMHSLRRDSDSMVRNCLGQDCPSFSYEWRWEMILRYFIPHFPHLTQMAGAKSIKYIKANLPVSFLLTTSNTLLATVSLFSFGRITYCNVAQLFRSNVCMIIWHYPRRNKGKWFGKEGGRGLFVGWICTK